MKNTYVIVDVESDGPVPGIHSMVCFGAVILDEKLDKTFYGRVAPISGTYEPGALAVSGFTREEHESFPIAPHTMEDFARWLQENCKGKPILLSDNNQYDGMFMNYYLTVYTKAGVNPFGWSSRRIGDMFCGFFKDSSYAWKKHRKTAHTHHPVDDAKGNAEAMLFLISKGFKLK